MTKRAMPALMILSLCLSCGCTAVGSAIGGKIGRSIGDAIARDPKADIANPLTLTRPGFSLRMPSNWTVNTKDDKYDPDRFFFIDTAKKRGFVLVRVDDKVLDPAAVVEKAVAVQIEKSIPRADRAPLSQWGVYSGVGAVLTGENTNYYPTTSRIFVFIAGARTFVILEWATDNDRTNDAAGFRLIERTFRVAGAEPPAERAALGERKGRAAFEAGRWEEAAVEFEKAYVITGDPALLFNMALCQRKAGNRARALALYQDYLRRVPDSPRRPSIEQQIRQLQEQLGPPETNRGDAGTTPP
jgi:hypothetical protein